MSFDHITNAIRQFFPALLLERVSAHATRRTLKKFFGFAFLVFLAFEQGLGGVFVTAFGPGVIEVLYGLTLISLSLFLALFLLEAFFYSHYFSATDTLWRQQNAPLEGPPRFEVADILYNTQGHDIVRGFLESHYGARILERSGVMSDAIAAYLKDRDAALDHEMIKQGAGSITTLIDFAQHAFRYDRSLSEWLLKQGVTEETLMGAATWVTSALERAKVRERWWGRETLGAIRGIGKDWAYGSTALLERYGKRISGKETGGVYSRLSVSRKSEATRLEVTLARARDANVFLVGEAGVGKMEIVRLLANRIESGKVLPPLEHKHLILLEGETLIANTGEKALFEREFVRFLESVMRAGNVILVLEDLPALIESAQAIDVNLPGLLESRMGSPALQVIATSIPDHFHNVVEKEGALLQRFEIIPIPELSLEMVITVLEEEAEAFEEHEGLFITYPALSAIAHAAEEYIPYGAMPDKAIDLLFEVVSMAKQQKEQIIRSSHVFDSVTQKTGVPVGTVTTTEREKLLRLESVLHDRVIGQDRAITAVSNAMRRARSGINRPDKPIASFLFLGPTGVGKTETSKALAEAFFGSSQLMIRLDMSEYATNDAVERLLGSFESERVGTLATLLEEHPYGLLLLDEFEKTRTDVLDLFLQVFDEGFFTDARGRRISARNLIIIATSNAGSDFIWEHREEDTNTKERKSALMNEIVARGIIKPELLNRFDDIILFNPLTKDELRQIASLLLADLQRRVKQQGITFVVDDPLLDILVEEGYDPKFGARPMHRVIQDKVEQVVAKKIISGELKSGSHITLAKEDLQ